jgi:hypothetical protein
MLAYSPGDTHQSPKIPPSGKKDLQPGKKEATTMADQVTPAYFSDVTAEDVKAVNDRFTDEFLKGGPATAGMAEAIATLSSAVYKLMGGKPPAGGATGPTGAAEGVTRVTVTKT